MTSELRALVVEGRLRQGLPPKIQDRAALARIAAILLLKGEAVTPDAA